MKRPTARASVGSWEGRRLQVWARDSRGSRFIGSVAVPTRPAGAARGVKELIDRSALQGVTVMITCFPPVTGCCALRNTSGAWKRADWLPFGASAITDSSNAEAMTAALQRERRARVAADRCDPDRLLRSVLLELRAQARGDRPRVSLSRLRKLLRGDAHLPGFAGRMVSSGALRAALETCVTAGHVEQFAGNRWSAFARVPHPHVAGATIPAALDPSEPGLSPRGREDRAAALDHISAGDRRRGGS